MFKSDNKKAVVIDILFFSVLVGIVSYFFWRLVFCQTIYATRDDGYISDVLAYMQEIQGIDSGYCFPYPLFFSLGRFFCNFMTVDYAVTWAEISLNVISLYATKYYFEKLIERDKDKLHIRLFISVVVISCFYLSMWWLPRFGKFYLPLKYQVFYGTYSGNPWHNATYIATRPFAIIAFFSFASILKDYEKNVIKSDFIVFGISLFLTTITKPSFTFVLVSTAGLIMAYRLFKSKFANIKNTLLLTICFIPTFLALLYQFYGVFGTGNTAEEHGIGFGWFEVWNYFSENIPASIFYANVFSFVCFLWFAFDLKKDQLYRFSVELFIVSIIEAGLLLEKGDRIHHFNFGWGYMHGIFFLETVTALKLIQQTLSGKKKIINAIGWFFFIIQLVAGILYFKGVYSGLDYKTLLPVTWL